MVRHVARVADVYVMKAVAMILNQLKIQESAGIVIIWSKDIIVEL